MKHIDLITWLWVMGLSIWGGTAHHIRKIKDGTIARFSIAEWLGDMVISGFIGLITYYFCLYSCFNEALTAALVGISAHQGTRGITLLERIVLDKVVIKTKEEI